jgi:hypothetical protein
MDSFKKLTKKNLVPFILKDPKKIFMKSSELSPNDGHRHVKGSLFNNSGISINYGFYKNITKF